MPTFSKYWSPSGPSAVSRQTAIATVGDRLVFNFTEYPTGSTNVTAATFSARLSLYANEGQLTSWNDSYFSSKTSGGAFTLTIPAGDLAAYANRCYVLEVSRTDSGNEATIAEIFLTLNGNGSVTAYLTVQGAQPLDATLTALSGLTIAANSLTIGTGADAFSQTTFAANTFPARASTGSLEAKTITDFGLSLVDDANAAAARATLGGTTVGQSLFTLSNPSAVTFPRMNADNTVSALSASDFRTAIGAGTSSFSGAFAALSGIPTSVSGYGISDAVTLTGGQTLTGKVFGDNVATQAIGVTGHINFIGGGNIAFADGGTITNVASITLASGAYYVFMSATTLTANRIVTFPDHDGTVFYIDGTADLPLAAGGTGASLADPGADRVMFWDESAGAVTWLTVGSGLSITDTTLAVSSSGATNIWVPASAMIPRVTNGPGTNSSEGGTNRANYDTLDFDTTTQEYAQFMVVMPSNYGGGTVTARFFWTADSGSGTVQFQLAGRALSDDDAIDTARGTAVGVSDTLITAGDLHRTAATAAITIAGSPAANALVLFEVSRDVASDNLGVDARLLGVEVSF